MPIAKKTYPTTEMGDAEFFADMHYDNLVFDHLAGRWMYFDGQHWLQQKTGEIHRMMIETIRTRQQIAEMTEDDALLKWAMKGESRSRQNNALWLARNIKPLAITGEKLWDWDSSVFGVSNGVVDLHSGELRHGRPSDHITRVSPLTYDPTIDTTNWEKFVLDVSNGDEELANYMQLIFGYCLTGEVSEQIFWIFYGGGANGKSTLIEMMLKRVMPQHSWTIDFPGDDWSAALSNYVRAQLVGRRLVISNETERAKRLSAKLIKSFTGSDTIAARHPYGRPFNFEPAAKFILIVNHEPVIDDDTYAMWRRVREVPFLRTFPVNKDFALNLRRNEARAALAWAVRGAMKYYREGFTTPQSVITATNNYRKSLNSVTRFIEDRCVIDPNARVGVLPMYQALNAWYDERSAPPHERMTMRAFQEHMGRDDRFFKMDGKGRGEQGRQFYHGIGLGPTTAITPKPTETSGTAETTH